VERRHLKEVRILKLNQLAQRGSNPVKCGSTNPGVWGDRNPKRWEKKRDMSQETGGVEEGAGIESPRGGRTMEETSR